MLGVTGSLWSLVSAVYEYSPTELQAVGDALACVEWLLDGYQGNHRSSSDASFINSVALGMFATSPGLISALSKQSLGLGVTEGAMSLLIYSAGYLKHKQPLLCLWSQQLEVLNASCDILDQRETENLEFLQNLYAAFVCSRNLRDFSCECTKWNINDDKTMSACVLAGEFWGVPESVLSSAKERTQKNAPDLMDRLSILEMRLAAYRRMFK